ncbi:MAG: hypothetical protein HUU22_19065 [Phycisphaerae bacterium]|nr:hypothetical protein [Phycisphaerae bacterium]NUQ48119.1 hypothetical protein [Phycisphaerae bacterium]
MNPETLERLLLDRSLGALSTDAAALLDAYLARDADAVGRAAALVSTVDLARRALADGASGGALPPFPAARLRREAVVFRRWRAIGRVTALAACVLLGVFIGRSYFDAGGPTVERDGVSLVSRPAPSPVTDEPATEQPASSVFDQLESATVRTPAAARLTSDGDDDFWSRRRMARRAAADVSTEEPGWIWQSPIHRPKPRGAS